MARRVVVQVMQPQLQPHLSCLPAAHHEVPDGGAKRRQPLRFQLLHCFWSAVPCSGGPRCGSLRIKMYAIRVFDTVDRSRRGPVATCGRGASVNAAIGWTTVPRLLRVCIGYVAVMSAAAASAAAVCQLGTKCLH